MNRQESNASSNDAAAPDLTSLSCDELWYKRNSYYKAAGYCFKTPRAIAQFGNSGCAFDGIDRVPISNADRTMISQIKALEQSRHRSR